MVPNRPQTNRNVVEAFESFFRDWLIRQEHYLQQLLQSLDQGANDGESDEIRRRELIGRVISHYIEYYAQKFRVARANVFLLFSPNWLTAYERNLLWIAGFKPGIAFRLVRNSVSDLTEEQSRRMERLVEETRADERDLAEELARVQEGAATSVGRNGGWEVDGAVERLSSEMATVVECADYLRGKTVLKVMDILNSVQTVRFLASIAQLQLRIRSWGLQREAQTHGTSH